MKLETETKCLWTELADYNTYQKNCEFLERNHNQEEKKKKKRKRNPREQIPSLNNRWLELFTVWQHWRGFFIKGKASQYTSKRADDKENPQTKAPVAFRPRP